MLAWALCEMLVDGGMEVIVSFLNFNHQLDRVRQSATRRCHSYCEVTDRGGPNLKAEVS